MTAPSTAPAGRPTLSTGRIVTVVVGSLLLLGGVGAAAGGSTALAADRAGGDTAGFVTDLGATATGLRWLWIGLYTGAGIGLIAGAVLILLAVGLRERRAT